MHVDFLVQLAHYGLTLGLQNKGTLKMSKSFRFYNLKILTSLDRGFLITPKVYRVWFCHRASTGYHKRKMSVILIFASMKLWLLGVIYRHTHRRLIMINLRDIFVFSHTKIWKKWNQLVYFESEPLVRPEETLKYDTFARALIIPFLRD